jgi:hypothetical protein
VSKQRKSRSKSTAKRRAAKVAATDTSAMTHPQLTETFNKLVPTAKKLGIAWARHHTSAFETRAGGIKQIARLEAAIAEAQAAR